MRCPFLREAQVKYCKASAVKRMIVRMPEQPVDERCSSREYETCPSLLQLHEDHPSHTHCPFLHESLVQYCAASPVTKYIPHSESSITRCGNDNHHYCELYVSVANPGEASGDSPSFGSMDPEDVVRLPERLSFTTNHFWIDRADDGMCHIGIDGFLAGMLQSVDKINFITTHGTTTPIVVITTHGVDLQCVFASHVNITAVNSYLRTAPEKLLTHPYSAGWLFEGTVDDFGSLSLVHGDEAQEWMKREFDHLTEYLHNTLLPSRASTEPLMADGGIASADLVNHLDHQELLHLFNEFFSPFANWRTLSC
jgi:glycine cleavage system H lipoate-binding protein